MTVFHNNDLSNQVIAAQLRLMATLLEIKGANSFRVRAYNQAADTIDTYPKNIAQIAEVEKAAEKLKAISGIGSTIAEKIINLVATGSIPQLEKLKEEVPEGLIKLTVVAGLGPKRVWQLFKRLRIKDLSDLRSAAESGEIQKLDGFGAKLEGQILADIDRATEATKRTLWPEAEAIAAPLLQYLKKIKEITQLEIAGSFRRKRETVGDLDILAAGEDQKQIIAEFIKYPGVKTIISQGSTKSTIMLDSGMQVDLRVVEPKSFGAALLYFTGSKAHGIALRSLAISQGKKVNEYGLYRNDEWIAGRTEEEMYENLGLVYIGPEMREDRGEIEVAKEKALPNLVQLSDIKGDFQCHTIGSDGLHTIKEMAEAAQNLGYQYLAITDHSDYIGVVNGLSETELRKQFKEVERLNEQYLAEGKDFIILKSAEVDILRDGSLIYSDELLAQLDFVVVSVHSSFGLSKAEQTIRVIKALENPHVHLFAHPTGRLIGRRKGYEIDLEEVFAAALETNTAIELNAQPLRLDLDDVYLQRAKELGVKIALSSDAHTAPNLKVMRYGIGQARRGWLEKKDILNTLAWKELLDLLSGGMYNHS